MTAPPPAIRFCFGVHLHQPIGNFDYVFEQHVRDVYLPFLGRVRDRAFFPIALHVSGPLLEWLEAHDTRFLDILGDLTSAGHVELLLAGFYEPVLASLLPRDRVEQVEWMRDALKRRFGVDASGLWLTERVWEPDLAADLARAGVRFVLVDDRHFLVSGFRREQLHAPHWTEHSGQRLALFSIDERLRYLIPFQPPEDTTQYLQSLREGGHRLAVLADDGEKFGGWPGTHEWVYGKGWLDRFFTTMEASFDRGDVMLSSFADALDHVPSGGIAYLPTASYREMEAWSLPAPAALRLAALERDVGQERLTGEDGALLRGSHWRNFLVKYREANRMHKKMLALSSLCRGRGDPGDARRAIGRAQCNDAYWHGVFGGLYLPFLRAALWTQLALAERVLRDGEALAIDEVDIDCDGAPELWIHSWAFSAIVSPARGGAIDELSYFDSGVNLANALTRRREAYHEEGVTESAKREAERGEKEAGKREHERTNREAERDVGSADALLAEREASGVAAPSIHDIEHTLRLDTLPPVDLDDRAIFVERVLRSDVTAAAYEAASYRPVVSAAALSLEYTIERTSDAIVVDMRSPDGRFRKTLHFSEGGGVHAAFRWDPQSFGDGDVFTTELSLDREHQVIVSLGGEVWMHRIETVAKSERGLDRTLQGFSYLVRWPVAAGSGTVDIPPV